MAGYGPSGYKSSSTLSPLAPPFTIDQSVPKFSFSSQSTGPLGDLPHQSNSGITDDWLHIRPPAESNQLMPCSLDANFPSLRYDHIFPYAQASMTARRLPVTEAGPFYPKYHFSLDRSVDFSLPPSLDDSSCSPVLAGPWDGSSDGEKVEPSVVYASYGKTFKGKMPISGKGESHGFSLSKENLGFWEGKSESFTNKDKMGLTISDDVGLLCSTKENSSGVLACNVVDQILHSVVEDNTGFLSHNMAKSCELQTGILKDTSFSHLSFPLVSMTDRDPPNPMPASCGSHQQVNLQSVEPAVSKTSSSLTLFNPGSNDNKIFQKEPTVFSWNIQEYAALPESNQSRDDGQKTGSQILKIGNKDVVKGKIDKKEMSFIFSSDSSSNNHKLDNAFLNQPNISTFTSGTDLPGQSSFEVSDQFNHTVDSPCWKGAPSSSSPFLLTIRTSEERSAVGLEVISPPKFSGNVVSKENTNVEVTCSNTNICVGPSGVWDSITCHVLPGTANSNLDLKAVSSPLNSLANVDTIRLSTCPETSECFESDVGNLPPMELKTKNDIVGLICNLSKLLCSSQQSALNTLKDEDYENLQLAVENLSTCLSARKMDDKLGCLYNCSKIAIPFKLIDRRNDLEDQRLSLNDKQNLCSSRTQSCNGLYSEDNFCKLDTFSSKGVDSHCRKSSPTEVFKKQFRENVFSMEEDHPQTSVYKRLWIEAEAALCSMKYKLQCAQKYLEMEKWKVNSVKGSEDSMTMSHPVLGEKAPTSDPLKGPSLDLNRGWTQRQGISSNDDVLQNFPDVDRTNQVDLSPEDLVMARLRILQHQVEDSSKKTLVQGINILDNMSQRGNSSGFDKGHNVEIEDHSKKSVDLSLVDSDSVIARFRILQNQIEGSSNKTLGQSDNISDIFSPVKVGLRSCHNVHNAEVEDHSKKMIDLDFSEEKILWNYVSEKVENVHIGAGEMAEPFNFVETIGCDMLADQMPSSSHFYGTRKKDFPSFDWEHVLKEELATNK